MQSKAHARLPAVALVGLALVLGGSSPVAAVRIEVDFAGEVAVVDDPGGVLDSFTISVGDAFSGRLHYDFPIADSDANASFGTYTDPDTELFVQHDDSTASVTVLGGPIEVQNSSTFDVFEASGTPDTINFFPAVDTTRLELTDNTGAVFSSDALPTDLDLADFDTALVEVAEEGNWTVFGEVTSLTVTTVPEPSTLLLVATGLAGLALSGGRGQKPE